MTTAIATLFMITSLTLATMSSKEKFRSIMSETEVPAATSSALPVPEAGDEKSE
jgi:preprotein translocase subunit SecG